MSGGVGSCGRPSAAQAAGFCRLRPKFLDLARPAKGTGKSAHATVAKPLRAAPSSEIEREMWRLQAQTANLVVCGSSQAER